LRSKRLGNTSLIFHGNVTSSITLPFDSPTGHFLLIVIIRTEYLNQAVFQILGSKHIGGHEFDLLGSRYVIGHVTIWYFIGHFLSVV